MFLVHVNVCDFAETMLIVVQINLILIWLIQKYVSVVGVKVKEIQLNNTTLLAFAEVYKVKKTIPKNQHT